MIKIIDIVIEIHVITFFKIIIFNIFNIYFYNIIVIIILIVFDII